MPQRTKCQFKTKKLNIPNLNLSKSLPLVQELLLKSTLDPWMNLKKWLITCDTPSVLPVSPLVKCRYPNVSNKQNITYWSKTTTESEVRQGDHQIVAQNWFEIGINTIFFPVCREEVMNNIDKVKSWCELLLLEGYRLLQALTRNRMNL